MITLIVARARNGAIGRTGTIPWHAPEDMRAFKRETTGGALVMGRRTWESLPVKPLPGRLNCVVSRSETGADLTCRSIEEAVAACREAGYHRIYGIGGEAIYGAMLPMAQRLLLTEVDLEVEAADAFFPEFDESDWTELHRAVIRAAEPRCTLRELLRRGH